MARKKKSAKSKTSVKRKPAAKRKITRKTKKATKKTTKKVQFVPKGYHSVTPYLIVSNGAAAIDFYVKVFGAKTGLRMDQPGGKVGHAELKIGDAKIMLADECPEMNALGPQNFGGSAVGIHLYIKNVDSIIEKAVAEGARLLRSPENMFYGDRSGAIEDPFGHKWYVSTHIEDVTPAQTRKRAAELFSKQ